MFYRCTDPLGNTPTERPPLIGEVSAGFADRGCQSRPSGGSTDMQMPVNFLIPSQ
jgi:hypothetical protein